MAMVYFDAKFGSTSEPYAELLLAQCGDPLLFLRCLQHECFWKYFGFWHWGYVCIGIGLRGLRVERRWG